MKRFLLGLVAVMLFVSCSQHKTDGQSENVPMDSLMFRVVNAIADSSRTVLEVEDELFSMLDSMQVIVESEADEDRRIAAKRFALDLCSVFLDGDCFTEEEMELFYDTLATRFSEVMHTWYSPFEEKAENEDPLSYPFLTQNVVFHDKWEGKDHVVTIDYYDTPDYGETVILTLPYDADYLTTLMFHKDGMDNLSDVVFSQDDALHVLEHADGGFSALFGPELLQAMLDHDGMYIGYIGKELNAERECLHYDCHVMLSYFHKQYQKLQ